MNKTAKDELYNHYYSAGVKLAMDKVGNMGTKALISRLSPTGSKNIAAGLGHAAVGSGAGALLTPFAAMLAKGPGAVKGDLFNDLFIGGGILGALGGKLIKDKKTRDIARSLNKAQSRAVLKGIGGADREIAGGVLSSVSPLLIGAKGPSLGMGISEAYTNRAVKNILKGKS